MRPAGAARSGVVRALVAVGISALLLSAPAWADTRIAFVDSQRLLQESPQGKAMIESLRSEFAVKQRELNAERQALKDKQAQLDRDGATMSADQRSAAEQSLQDGQRDLDEKANEYQDEFNTRQNQEMSKVSAVLSQQIRLYGQAHHFDLVLAGIVIWHNPANPAIDITQPLLAALQAQGSGSRQSGSTQSGSRGGQ